ncbi:uncharacterized protein LOC110441076, partial [Mizuhopecten yessoensis]|uniref:uncharacterized protein LOC110441076 n=1 Tax=Mizuhopecten yessoensis TaxID=6573 RepID=UPI000B45A975
MEVTTNRPPLDKTNMYGSFVGKTAFYKDQLYFEVKNQEKDIPSSEKVISIGLCELNFSAVDFLGEKASVGYHNTGIIQFEGESEESKKDEYAYGPSTVIGCGVEATKGKSLQFTEDGKLISQQKLLVYFTKNGKRIYEKELTLRWDGLFPSVCMVKNYSVRLLNFYPETKAIRQQLQLEKEERE